MAEDTTKRRLRRTMREELKRLRQASTRPLGPGGRGPRFPDDYLPGLWRDLGPDEEDGGAGVREPRHPRPTMPAAALALDEPEPQYLDLSR